MASWLPSSRSESAAGGPGGELTTARRAVIRALGIAGENAPRLVLTGDSRHADRVLAGLGTDPPPPAELRVAARPGLMVVDATRAGERSLRRLARALPRERPIDGIGHVPILDREESRGEADSADRLARLLRVRAALHVVVPRESDRPIFEPCPGPNAPNPRDLVRGLRERLVHAWLAGGARPYLGGGAPEPDERFEARLESAIGRSRSGSLVLSSLAWGGRGLTAAAEAAWDRTVPREPCIRGKWVGAAALAAGVVLGSVAALAEAERAAGLESALSELAPVLPRAYADPASVSGEARALRFSEAAARLERAAAPRVSSPLSGLLPGGAVLRKLASRTIADAVVRPAEATLRRRLARDLRPGADPREWLNRATRALARTAESGPFGPAAVLAAAYDSPQGAWRRRLAGAIRGFPARAFDPLTDGERDGFVRTMEAWIRDRHAKSDLLRHARNAADAPGWRGRRAALQSLEGALTAGADRWSSPGGADPELERNLARARGVLDEKTVKRARAAASRAGGKFRRELAGLLLVGAYPLVEMEEDGPPVLSRAANGLLRAYETLSTEDLLDPHRGRAPGTTAARFTAREVLASLKRLEGRIAEVGGIGRDLHNRLKLELETSAFDEAAERLETTAAVPLAAGEWAAVQEIEGLARDKGAWPAAVRIGAVRARLEESTSRAALRAIEVEDPLAVDFDADTDRRAVLERVVAGIDRLDALYRQEPGSGGVRWAALGRTLRGYRNADRSSVLTRFVERARDYAERGANGCSGPAKGESGHTPRSYPERAWASFERRLDALCRDAGAGAALAAEDRLRSFYREQLSWRWPYSDEPGAPVVPRSTLVELLRRAEGRAVEELSPDLGAILAPWRRNQRGEPVLELDVAWRTAPGRERNAEHVVSYRLEGLQNFEDGRRGWRYGDRLQARLRLAKDSPLRFPGGAVVASIPIGKGAWLRSLATGAPSSTVAIEAPVTGGSAGGEGTLRISATLSAVHAPRPVRTPIGSGPPVGTARPVHASRGTAGRLP